MKFAILVNEGFEDLAAEEAGRLINAKPKEHSGFLLLDATKEEIVKYVYLTQAAKRVLLYLSSFKATSKEEILEAVSPIDTKDIAGSFCVRSTKSSYEKDIADVIHKKLSDPKVDLDHPDSLIYFQYNRNESVIGIDITQQDLSKRSHRVFAHPTSIKGTLGYYLVALSGFDGAKTFLDPCAGSGTICAEAAFRATGYSLRFFERTDLFSTSFFDGIDVDNFLDEHDDSIDLKQAAKDTSIVAYDVDLQAVNAMKKNFKIAGIENLISVGKGDIDWLETKFEKGSIEHIATNPPEFGKHTHMKVAKFYDMLFYQTEFVLSDKGRMIILSNEKKELLELAKKYGLDGKVLRTFRLGHADKYILSFSRK
ncbi:MAG: methyltransferase [Nanoarchaeota archaeon]